MKTSSRRDSSRYKWALALSTAVALGLSGCAWKGEGLVHSDGPGAWLETSTGQRMRLLFDAERAPMRHLEGHILAIEGTRIFKNVRVSDVRIPSGVTGMPVWFGRLERRGMMLGMTDYNTGGSYFLFDADVYEELAPFVGEFVLIEGYVDGPHRVRVMQFEVLR